MNTVDKETYFKIIEQFKIIPFTQSKSWHDMHNDHHPEKIVCFVNDLNKPTIACFAHIKKFFFLKMLLIEGECYLNESAQKPADIRRFYENVREKGFDMVEVISNAKYSFDYETALRQSGFLRPVGQFIQPVTKIIDLTQPLQYNQNWKRNIKKAYDNQLLFEVITNEKLQKKDCEDFIKIYDDMSERKKLSFNYNQEQIYRLCKSQNFQLFFVSFEGKRQTTIIIHKEPTHAGLLYAASAKQALSLSASFFMYENLYRYLASEGYKTFDMEKLVPSTASVNDVFNFKNGVKGAHIQLNGEWSWYRKQTYRPLMYFVKKHLMKKTEM